MKAKLTSILVIAVLGVCHRLRLRAPDSCRGRSRSEQQSEPGSGVESDLRRDADRDEHGEFVESAARSDRSHGHLRCLNGIERRYTPIFVQNVDGNGKSLAPPGASRRAAVIAAAYTALVGLFPSRAAQLSDSYAASLAALSDDGGDGGRHGSAASRGAQTLRGPCSPGARRMASARATRRLPEERRSVSGARSRPPRR